MEVDSLHDIAPRLAKARDQQLAEIEARRDAFRHFTVQMTKTIQALERNCLTINEVARLLTASTPRSDL